MQEGGRGGEGGGAEGGGRGGCGGGGVGGEVGLRGADGVLGAVGAEGVGGGMVGGVDVGGAEGLGAGRFESGGGGMRGEGESVEGAALGVGVVAVGLSVCVAIGVSVAVPVGDGVGVIVCFRNPIGGAHAHHPSWVRILDHHHHPNSFFTITAKERCAAQPSRLRFGYGYAVLAIAVPPVLLSVSPTSHAAEFGVGDHGGGVVAVRISITFGSAMREPGNFRRHGDTVCHRVLDAVADSGRSTYTGEERALEEAGNAECRGHEDDP